MKKIITVLLFLLPIFLSANFIGMNYGARALALGNAYIALADEPTAIFFNPAGLAKIDSYYLKASHENLYGITDLYNDMLALAAPLPYVSIGAGCTQIALWDEYSEQVFYLSAASKIFLLQKQIFFGTSFKYQRTVVENYSDADEPANFDLDIGIIGQATDNLQFAFTTRNLLRPEFKFLEDSDRLDLEYILGMSYNWRNSVNFVFDRVWKDDDSFWNLGSEMWFYNVFAARLGMQDGKLTTGFGIKAARYTIDGAVLSHDELGSTYRIAVGLKIGGRK